MNRTDPTGLWDIPGWVPVVGGMCVDIADPNCVTPAEGQPNDVGNFASGMLSLNPITGTMDAFGLIDTGKYADTCSGWYTAGQATMFVLDVASPVSEAVAFSRGARVRFAVHDAHHTFGSLGKLPHLQWNFWRKGVPGSGRVFRIPFPKSWFR